MSMKVKCRLRVSHKFLLSTLFAVVLFTACFVSAFSAVSPFVYGSSDKVVSDEVELRNVIKTAAGATVIALSKDISLTESIDISAGKRITLTSAGGTKFFKLIGACDQTTVNVENRGLLTIDGIIVTHDSGEEGNGVIVDYGGVLVLHSGEISGNTAYVGAGVHVSGTFNMSGGKISGNTADTGAGVGVVGNFSMSGGEISNNTNTNWGGGGVYLYQYGTFNLSGGTISGNTITRGGGGGVCNFHGIFSMSGGEISGNKAILGDPYTSGCGGGVANYGGRFFMSGGVISGNTAYRCGGGVYNNDGSVFFMSGGVISGNDATDDGGGVYIYADGDRVDYVLSGGEISHNSAVKGGGVYYESVFNPYISYQCFEMAGGVIYGNTAFQNGGGVYVRRDGAFSMSGGEISGNSAAFSGGGVWIDVNNLDNLSIADGVMFSNNRASAAYNRDPVHDELYRTRIGDMVSWSSPFTQGYNNYDISYTSGTLIPDAELSNNGSRWLNILGFIVVLVLIAGTITTCLVFFQKRRKK